VVEQQAQARPVVRVDPGVTPARPGRPAALGGARRPNAALTAKAVGSTSAGLRHAPIGSRAFVEGPYGALTSAHRTRPGALLAVGDVVVLYRVRSEHDAVLVDEVRHLVAERRGRLHLLTGPRDAGATPFAPDGLCALVPDIAERDVYVCGPPSMTSTVLSTLSTLEVHSGQLHAGRFGLA
jgi:predicted ferric reductase